MTLLSGLVTAAALAVIIAAAARTGRWVRTRLQAATWRQATEAWQEISVVRPALVASWPDGLTATQYFFGTDEVWYDPAADAAVYCETMAADVQAWMTDLHQAA